MDKSIKSVTASELITHLQKFNKDAIVHIVTNDDDDAMYVVVDDNASFILKKEVR